MARRPAATRQKWVRFPPASLTANCRFGLHLVHVASEPFSSLVVCLPNCGLGVHASDRSGIYRVRAPAEKLSNELRWVFETGRGDCRLEYIGCRFESDHPPCQRTVDVAQQDRAMF